MPRIHLWYSSLGGVLHSLVRWFEMAHSYQLWRAKLFSLHSVSMCANRHAGGVEPVTQWLLLLVLVYTQEGSLWSILLRCDDHTGIFTYDGCAWDPYFYVPAETQSYVIKLSCSRKVLAASGD